MVIQFLQSSRSSRIRRRSVLVVSIAAALIGSLILAAFAIWFGLPV
jgi:hypothetical protein